MNERRLSGRDVLAKTFQTKTKRGYDPVEVDAYLELVAAQIDMLHGDLAAAGAVAPDGTIITAGAQPEASAGERDALLEEIEALRADRDRLATANAELVSRGEALEAENEQLRIQLTAVQRVHLGRAQRPSEHAHVVQRRAQLRGGASLRAPRALVRTRADEEQAADTLPNGQSFFGITGTAFINKVKNFNVENNIVSNL